MDKGFIKVPRGISGWREFSDPALFYAYFALMSNMRFTETVIDGITVGAGQLLVSKTQLSELFGMSVSRTRSTLSRFEKMGGIKKENIRNRYTLITVLEPFFTGVRNQKAAPKRKAVLKNETADEKAAENKAEHAIKREAYMKAEDAADRAEALTEERKDLDGGQIVREESINLRGTAEKAETAAENENKSAYGKFNNVYLTDDEYEDFRHMTPDFSFFIDSLSARLINSGGKKYISHYALLINNFNEDKLRRREYEEPEKQFGICSSNASYDIQRAEERAKTVPKLKKRERR